MNKLLRIQFSEIRRSIHITRTQNEFFRIYDFVDQSCSTRYGLQVICHTCSDINKITVYMGDAFANVVIGFEPHAPVTQRWSTFSDYGRVVNHVMKFVYGINLWEQVIKKRENLNDKIFKYGGMLNSD